MAEALIQVGGRSELNGHGFARLAVTAARFASDIVCMANGRSVKAKDVMSVMSLRAKPGALGRVLATGPDALVALEALSAILRAQESL